MKSECRERFLLGGEKTNYWRERRSGNAGNVGMKSPQESVDGEVRLNLPNCSLDGFKNGEIKTCLRRDTQDYVTEVLSCIIFFE